MNSTPSDPHGPDVAHGTPPVCPRHPGRAAYVRCSACGTPACLECQRHGAAGRTLCPDCAAGAAHHVSPAPDDGTARPGAPTPSDTAPAGGAVGTPGAGGPLAAPVTWVLLVATVLAYGAQWLTRSDRPGVTGDLAYAGAYTSQAFEPVLGFQPWRMLTYALAHDISGPTHLALNMLALWVLGRALEPLLGWWRFLCLYALSAVGGAVFALWTTDPLQPVVGASGAVYGLFSALFLLTRFRGGQVRSIAVLIGLNFVISLVIPGISWQVHVGGLLTGALVGAAFTAAGGPPRARRAGGTSIESGASGTIARRGGSPGVTAGVHVAALVLVGAALTMLTLLGAAQTGRGMPGI